MTKRFYSAVLAMAAAMASGCKSADPEMESMSCAANFQEIAHGEFMARRERGTATLVFILEAQSTASRATLYRDWRLNSAATQTVTGDPAQIRVARQRFLERGAPVPAMLIADEHLVRIAGPTGTGLGIVERACAMQRPGVRLKQISVGTVGPDGGETLRQLAP